MSQQWSLGHQQGSIDIPTERGHATISQQDKRGKQISCSPIIAVMVWVLWPWGFIIPQRAATTRFAQMPGSLTCNALLEQLV